jgi:hypothetical protein
MSHLRTDFARKTLLVYTLIRRLPDASSYTTFEYNPNKLDIDESPGARIQTVTSGPVVAEKLPPIWTGQFAAIL